MVVIAFLWIRLGHLLKTRDTISSTAFSLNDSDKVLFTNFKHISGLKTTPNPINSRTDKYTEVHSHNGILYSNQNK